MDATLAIARDAIRDTLARYHFAGDRGRLEELVACFTEEGVLEISGEAACRGRQAILARMRAAVDTLRSVIATATAAPAGGSASPGVPLLRHHLTTSRIELEPPDRARAWSYFLAVTEVGPDHSGRYVDAIERVGSEWLLSHRRVSVDWVAPESRYATSLERSRVS
jgi:hypothetical protein